MAMHTVKDENDLDADCSYYIKSLSVPTVLIHGRTGDGYQRYDGKDWPFDGLRVEIDRETGKRSLERAHNKIG